MLRRIILALIGLLAVVNGSKWLFDGKRLPTLGLREWSQFTSEILRFSNVLVKPICDRLNVRLDYCLVRRFLFFTKTICKQHKK